ncbi:MAG: hypothetical protein PUC66_01510 [Erysipelotrichaceae bacterium]|nr:hypothetical protein [Erysipelotrichaceae bacterium]
MSEKENKNIIVIQDGSENAKNGLTWGQYGHFIAHYRWWVLGFTLGSGILAFLITQYVLSPRKVMLNATVQYDIALVKDQKDDEYHYLDGSPFSYLSLVSDDTIQNVIDAHHKGLDLQKIKSNNAITVTPVLDETGKEVPLTFTISGKAQYLGGAKEGTKFIEDLIVSVKDRASVIASSYQTNDYLSDLSSTSSFEDTIKVLNTQYEVIDELYQDALSVFSGTLKIDGVALSNHYDRFETAYSDNGVNVFVSLQNELRRNRYVNYQDGEESKWIDYYTRVGQNEIQYLKDTQKQIDILQARLNDLKSAPSDMNDEGVGSEIVTISRSLQQYELQKNDLENNLDILGYRLNSVSNEYELNANDASINGKIQHLTNPSNGNWRNECLAFANTLTSYVTQLQGDTASAENNYRFLYTNCKNRVYYPSTGIVASGGYNAWLGGFVGLAIGFLGSSLICSAVGMSKRSREEAKNAESEKK